MPPRTLDIRKYVILVVTLVLHQALAVSFLDSYQNFSDHGAVVTRHSQKIYHPSEHGEAFSSSAFSLGNTGPSDFSSSGPSADYHEDFSTSGFGDSGSSGFGYEKALNSLDAGNTPVSNRYHEPVHHQTTYFRPTFNTDNTIGMYPGASTQPPQTCHNPVIAPCRNLKYRTIDGSCNNLRNPAQGTPNTRYNRLLSPRYSDGLHAPPTSVTGHPLPGARLASIVMFPDKQIDDPVWTLISMQWGQIITHDMSMAMGTTQAKPYPNQCCTDDGKLLIPVEQSPAQCFPIVIPDDDPLFSKFHRTCMNFQRSSTDVERGCAPPNKPHEQIVTTTHYMDASMVYGSTPESSVTLRQGYGGRLRVDVRGGKQWPPPAANKSATCETQHDDEPCYRFGDVRANQNPQLTVLQIIFLREHNRIADTLAHLNPHWDDERIFQEARRILIAEFQHINYVEWLPIFIGTKNMMKHGLLYKTHDYVNDYREDVDPSVLNDHATAAFRYFHTAIQGFIHLVKEQRSIIGTLRLSDFFNRPGVIEEGDNMDKLTRGMSTQSQEEVDPFLTSEITDYLFRNGKPFGRDLRAIDIQRGRDHGLRSYNDYRHFCGLPKARKWEDFADFIRPQDIEKLSILYHSVDDVDLVVGGSLEKHIKDTLTGPTFLCIMTEQFYRTRVGDRFWYERSDHPGAFTKEQLNEIRKSTVSRLLCDNGDDIKVMQPEGFRVIGEKNPLVPCHDTNAIPAVDLSLWKEEIHDGPSLIPGLYDYFGKK